jgi:hypothetical protein
VAPRLRPSTHSLALPRRRRTSLHAAWASAAALAIAGACIAPAADAQVTTLESVKVGMQPRTVLLEEGTTGASFANATGNSVVPASSIYAIYWDPQDLYHGDWQHLIDGFLHNAGEASGSDSVFTVDKQYTDASGQHAASSFSFKGAYTDTHAYPTAECTDPAPLGPGEAVTCLTDEQIRTELQAFITSHSLPRGLGTVYYVLTPPGVTTCLGKGAMSCSDYSGLPEGTNPSYAQSFCSYHADINPGPGEEGDAETVLYAVLPWTAGGLGDGDLPGDHVSTFDCQAGGWMPSNKGTEAEELEKEPAQQEPNQDGRSPDGWFDTGLADLIVSQIGVQLQGVATDPLLNGWQDSTGMEVTDECRDFFAPSRGGSNGANSETHAGTLSNQILGGGSYYINDAFDLAAYGLSYPGVPCLGGISLVPQFTAPTAVNAGEVVGFDGMESNVTLDWGTAYTAGKATPTYASYEWNFGDGTTVTGFAPGAPPANAPAASPCEAPWIAPCAASAFHSYTYGGTYNVTLKITDTGGNVASVTEHIKVNGPPPPPPGGSSGKSGLSAVSVSGSKTTTSGSGRALSKPVVTAMVSTRSLSEALRKGLPVRYSVNQQVAGHVEVLLPTHLAKRLHIKGPAARGLAPGAAPQTQIAYALLVTMRQAHGTLRITIPHSTAARLAHMRQVTITVRLLVRNAARSRSKTTQLQFVVKLHR